MFRSMSDFLAMTPEQVEGLAPEQVEAVLAAWVKAKRTELPEALAGSKSKPLAKLAKKALYQLKSMGLEVKDAAPAETTKAPEGAEPAGLPAVLSPVVGTGERAILFATPVRGGGLEIFQGVISDEFGVVQFGAGNTNRNTYRAQMNALERDGLLKVLKVPLSRMKLELGRAMTMNERSATRLPEEWEASLRRLGVSPQDPDFPIPAPEAFDEREARNGASLQQEPELGQWMPSEAELAKLGEIAREVRSSPLALTDAQKAAQLSHRAAALARDFLTPEKRKLYARRLWVNAEIFEASERPAQAKLARAEARRLFHTSEPCAFLERMFTKAAETSAPPPSAAEVVAERIPIPRPK
ncbi:MAG: hypothetical protein AMXMBFR34_27340 [Myxococcaceae bacterium]